MTISTFYLFDNSDPTGDTAIAGAQVRVYSESGDTFVTLGTTGSDGEVTFDLPDDTYWVRFFKTGFSFPSRQSATIDAAETNIFDISGDNLEELPPSAADGICRVSGYLVGAGGEPLPGASLEFTLNADYRRISVNRLVVSSKITSKTNKEGYFEIELLQGGMYDALIQGMEDSVVPVKVPEVQAVRITELLWPYAARVEPSAAAVSLSVGSTVEVPVTVVTSSYLETPYEYFEDKLRTIRAASWVRASSSDTDVVSVTLVKDSLRVTGLSAGSATVTFSEIGNREKRLPSIDLEYDSIAIMVS